MLWIINILVWVGAAVLSDGELGMRAFFVISCKIVVRAPQPPDTQLTVRSSTVTWAVFPTSWFIAILVSDFFVFGASPLAALASAISLAGVFFLLGIEVAGYIYLVGPIWGRGDGEEGGWECERGEGGSVRRESNQ